MQPDKQLVENSNSLQVKQLIYTSFCGKGFTLLTSKNIPALVQQSFTRRFVQTFWDPYLPPSSDYRAAYLSQMPPELEGTLFGWLYHDGFDEIGRSDIPYFIAYYLPGLLPPSQLSAILTVLEQGPVSWIDRHDPPAAGSLETLTIENVRKNRPIRQGVSVPTAIRVQSYEAMQSQVPIDYFFANTSEHDSAVAPQVHHPNSQLEHRLRESSEQHREGLLMDSNNVDGILRELISKPIGIHGAVLVSAEGQAVATPMGIDESSAAMMAGTMIYLAKNTQAALNWHDIEIVSMKASEGYVILSRCSEDTYLLIQSGKVPLGLLEGEISQTVAKVRAAFSMFEEPNAVSNSALKPQGYFALAGDPEESVDRASQVTYRGRRTGS
jgi:predicted regulator of Ras-like GTPase activity (Roadblock/LC7/MglB family)